MLSNINLSVEPGEVVGLIGRSGAGKSTLARCLVGLERPDKGKIYLDGQSILPGKGAARRRMQYLWQDPTQALSPYLTAENAVLETLNGFAIGAAGQRIGKATSLLEKLKIPREAQTRRPHSLSGGQCQRVALARALAAESDVLILDEPLSSLDLTTQINTVRLLRSIHASTGVTMLIVSHDLAPLRHLADRIAVLDGGRIVEAVAMARFEQDASHPLSRAYADVIRGQWTNS
ncbi:dipeptide/oligopeptide/nickel ABC transporter ATP-binding protein [Actibacterium sp. 188UL27-1]|uniref:ABC transporter ATP-binding protein n=1 Tax=Actibacterium sp. 188UL27-1 TaxID=2786961 RepID=UPI00195E3E24|nr:ABC transporter ATP-binding protein [Actibacterium sp. 188UL27-1]